MSKNSDFELSLELVRDAAASRRSPNDPVDGAVGAIHRALTAVTTDDDPDRLLEGFTHIAAAALEAINHLITSNEEEA